jgi:hypothetical protein
MRREPLCGATAPKGVKSVFKFEDKSTGRAALPFYETVLGVRVLSRSDTPHSSAVLARDQVEIGLAENGGDSTQDGCAFQVKGLAALFAAFKASGLQKELSEFDIEEHDGVAWKVFYVVAPDGLCYWFGEKQAD